MSSKLKKKIHVQMWPDQSGAKLFFDLIGKKKMLRAMVGLPELECDVIDRHCKATIFEKYKSPCDVFRNCKLSIANYEIIKGRNLKDIGIKGLFEILENVWEKDKE